MKRFLPILILYILISSIFIQKALAVTKGPVTPSSVEVSAIVGDYTLNISGYIAPNASVSLTIDGSLLRGTVADAQGYFSMTAVKIKKDTKSFCLTAVDFKQLGDSETCIDIPSGSGNNITKADIFLPPTFGLSRSEVNAGGVAIARGYSMPGAQVTIHLNNGKTFTVTANDQGYYEVEIKGLVAGKYLLYADAVFKEKKSLKPQKQKELKILTLGESSVNLLQSLWDKLREFFTSLGLGPLLLAIPILILIIILLYKLHPQWFEKLRPIKRLHHWWWVGY